jgi:restriction endonuclease Mrr
VADRIEYPHRDALKALLERALGDLGGRAHRSDLVKRAIELGNFSTEQLSEPTHSLGKRKEYRSELEYRLSWALTYARKDGTVEKVGGGYWQLVGSDWLPHMLGR